MNRCSTITLARASNCLIDYCPDCQVMHLHLDTITLKIQRSSLGSLRDLIDEALLNLHRFEHDTSSLLAHFSSGRHAPN